MSRPALDRTLEYIRDIERARSPAEIAAALLRATKPFGCQGMLAGLIPSRNSSKRQQEAHALLKMYPTEWLDRYLSRGYVFVDPTVRRLLSDSRPFLWSELDSVCRDNPAAMRVMNEAADFGLKGGITIPLVTPDGIAGFALAGEKIEISPHDHGMIVLLATYALVRAIRLHDVAGSSDVVLSVRERDVLQWAAEGKSEWEIGMTLGISEHTAEKHLRSAREKLGATNRTHAVAKAIRLGLIS